jgi:NADPH2:quinone reductase
MRHEVVAWMRAAVVRRFGTPDVLRTEQWPDPSPGAGEVRLAVAAIDVLFFDTMLRRGLAPPGFEPELPWIPGNAVSGQVLDVGVGVDERWIGRRLLAHTGNRGAYAERVVVPVSRLVQVPDGVQLRDAAAVAHDLPTALTLFDVTGADRTRSILIVGASGGLGLMLAQLALNARARVVALARDAGKRTRVRRAAPGATVLDPLSPRWPADALAALGGSGADVVFDNVGGALGEAAFELAAPGGRFSAHGTPSGTFARIPPERAQAAGVTVTGIEPVQLDERALRRASEHALGALADGRCRPVIGQAYPLERAAEAHTAIEARAVFGATVLEP